MRLGRYGTLLVLAMTVVGASLVTTTAAADGSTYDSSLQAARDKVGALRGLGNTLQKASEEPPPPKLTPDQLAEVKKYDAWLRTANERVVKLAASWEQKVEEIRAGCQKDPSCNRIATAKALSETNMSFNLQYLQLQSQMQHENRSYTAVSNIMKTKHDTVKNSISNVR